MSEDFASKVSATLAEAGIHHTRGDHMSTTEDETTMTMTAGGRTTGPVPLSALGRVGQQLAMFEGRSYPDVEIRLTGGLTGDTLDCLPDVTGNRVGEPFTLVVSGEIVAKQYKLKRDSEGDEIRVLVVTLKADDMRVLGDG